MEKNPQESELAEEFQGGRIQKIISNIHVPMTTKMIFTPLFPEIKSYV